jgi:hypothetical protein
MLRDREEAMGAGWTKEYSKALRLEAERRAKEGYKTPETTSRSLRQPQRLGREPEPNAPEWYLGGRESEELVPSDPSTNPPPASGGYSLGRGSSVPSIDEVAGMVQAAKLAAGEAHTAAEQAEVRLNEAFRAISEVAGDTGSATFQEIRELYSKAQGDAQNIQGLISFAAEKIDGYIARLYS